MLGSAFTSPQKRKRAQSDSTEHPSAVRLKTDLPTRPLRESHEQQSPRTAVSRDLSSLSLDAQNSPANRPHLKPLPVQAAEMIPSRQVSYHSQDPTGTSAEGDSAPMLGDGSVQHRSSQVSSSPAGIRSQNIAASSVGNPSEINVESTSTVNTASMVVPRMMQSDEASIRSPSVDRTRRPRTQASSPKRQQHVDSSLNKPIYGNRVVKSRKRKSPPPFSINDLVWSDAEITGHNPIDSDDDMYGINGVGFKLTPAMEEGKRAQRRKQIAEWRKREEDDRRARRHQARNQGEPKSDGVDDASDGGGKRVRFIQEQQQGSQNALG